MVVFNVIHCQGVNIYDELLCINISTYFVEILTALMIVCSFGRLIDPRCTLGPTKVVFLSFHFRLKSLLLAAQNISIGDLVGL